ncbi:OmpA family protein [Cytophagaceae bacterium YF14B1]|uniref:OmpA family protein n=1 Tax=Xanthocytophaga flava TaxID=3048013 RepID=A0AAE3QMR4_9BACT|nr:OmpA family protein [Xanthocytophaga flavus]MDJ1481860.1 OmpA family protein [Xanthocytophaga flavus]
MKYKYIKISAWLFFLASPFAASAQEFGVELNGGLQGLKYTLPNSHVRLQPGASLGINYTFPLATKWGLLTGISGSYYATKVTLRDGAVFSSYQVDTEGSAFQYKVSTIGYQENQRFWAVGIPVMLQYHTDGEKTQWYIDAGTRIIFPFNATIKTKSAQITTTGYYPDFNVEVHDLPQHGFGSVNNWQSATKTSLKPTATLSAATGLSFRLSPVLRLYTGIYVDYGLTNMRKGEPNQPLVSYESTNVNAIKTSSVLNTVYASNPKLTGFGVQVRLTFGKRKSKDADTEADKPQAVTTDVPASEPKKTTQEEVKRAETTEQQVETRQNQPTSTPSTSQKTITNKEKQVVEEPMEFDKLGQTEIPESMKSHLDSVAAILLAHPELRVSIVGHTCDLGTEEVNLRVGKKRATLVANYLAQKGVGRNRMDVDSAGESQPLVPNTSEQNRRKNRRVEIEIESPETK